MAPWSGHDGGRPQAALPQNRTVWLTPIKAANEPRRTVVAMNLTDILLLLRPGQADGAACDIAARLAQAVGARVEGVCLPPMPAMEPADCYAVGADAVHDVVARWDRDIQTRIAEARAPFDQAMRAAGCAHDWTVSDPSEMVAETALRARLVDLVVMTRPEPHHSTALPLAEAMVRLGGAPCLLAPPAAGAPDRFDHIVLAWNGSRQAKRAMDDSMLLLRRAESVSILVVGSTDGMDQQLAGLVSHLRRSDVDAKAQILAGGPGSRAEDILAWCAGHGADLLVMGAFGHTPRAEQWFGGTSWTVLTRAPLPVFMSC
jgi:nucleotide-binding universal stress UspA family protein